MNNMFDRRLSNGIEICSEDSLFAWSENEDRYVGNDSVINSDDNGMHEVDIDAGGKI